MPPLREKAPPSQEDSFYSETDANDLDIEAWKDSKGRSVRTEKLGYNWDYCLVFKVYEQGDNEVYNAIAADGSPRYKTMFQAVRALNKGGLDFQLFYSSGGDFVFCKVHCPLVRLKQEADRINKKLKLNHHRLRVEAWQGAYSKLPGQAKKHPAGVRLSNSREVTKQSRGTNRIEPVITPDPGRNNLLHPWKFHFIPYNMPDPTKVDRVEDLFQRYPEDSQFDDAIFHSAARLELIYSIMSASTKQDGCGLKLRDMYDDGKGPLAACFPLHEPRKLGRIKKHIFSWCRLPQHEFPVWGEAMQQYFGQQITLYFYFLTHYTTWLLLAALMGGITTAYQMCVAGGNIDSYALPLHGLLMCTWACCFLSHWKQKQKENAMRHGMIGYELSERDNETFRHHFRVSMGFDLATGKKRPYVNRLHRTRAWMTTFIVVGMCLLGVTLVVGSILGFQAWTALGDAEQYGISAEDGQFYAGLMNAAQIIVLNYLYTGVAEWVNDQMGHRTDTQYMDCLVYVTFGFLFINSYATLFYIAFAKELLGETCINDNCVEEIYTTMTTIFITKLVSSNLTEAVISLNLAAKFKEYITERFFPEKAEGSAAAMPMKDTRIENEFQDTPYIDLDPNKMSGLFLDYAEIIIQFGYIGLFTTCFPTGPILALLNNYIEIRLDGFGLTHSRRSIPHGAEDIGAWESIMEMMVLSSCLSNNLIVFFVSKAALGHLPIVWRFIAFIVAEHVLLLSQSVIAMCYPAGDLTDDNDKITVQLRRREYITQHVIKLEEDSEEEEDDDGSSSSFAGRQIVKRKMMVHRTDPDETSRDGKLAGMLETTDSGSVTYNKSYVADSVI
jgi:anoctamin-10/anoctamin-7